jgi:hypothetical protein
VVIVTLGTSFGCIGGMNVAAIMRRSGRRVQALAGAPGGSPARFTDYVVRDISADSC